MNPLTRPPRSEPQSQLLPDSQLAELPDYARTLDAYHCAHAPELRQMIRDLPIRPSDRILDVPCGDGYFSTLLAECLGPGGEVVAADVSDPFLDVARQRCDTDTLPKHGSMSFDRCDVYDMPYDDESFDVVWCAQSLMSLDEPVKALREVHRVLRPGGWVAVLEDDELHRILLSWPADLELQIHSALRRVAAREGDSGSLQVGRYLLSLLRDAGFESLRRQTFTSDRQAPLDEAPRLFVSRHLQAIYERVRDELSDSDRERFRRRITPGSSDCLWEMPDFEMTCIDILRTGYKPAV